MDGAQDQALAPRHATTPLKRGMTGFGGFLITLSGLSPSIGVFIVGSDVLHQTGTGAFVCFLAAVVLGIAMCCVYAELGSAFPHTGGEYTVAGHVLGPAAGFAMLAMNLVGYSIALALSGLGIADYLRAVVPVAPVPTAIAAIAAVTMCGVLSIRFNARVTGAFLVVELLALAVTAALGFAHGHGDVLQLVTHPAVGDGHDGLRAVPAVTLCVGAVASIYAFNGYGAVIFLGEEMQQARRRVGAVVFWSLAVAAVTELVPMLAIIAGATNIGALTASASPVPHFLAEAGGAALSRLISLAVASAIFNAMIAVAVCGSRQIYASARDRCWPEAVSRRLDQVHTRFGSPWIASLVLGGAAFLWCFVPLHVLVVIIANGNVAIYATLCVAVMAGRRNGTTAGSLARMRLFPLAPMFALVCLAGTVWADLLDAETGRPGLIATMVVFVLGVAYYQVVLKQRHSWRLEGPPE
jgi:amino acid transporter